jgi:hypothetical protein
MEEFKKKYVISKPPKMFKNERLMYRQTKDNRLVSFPPRETKLGSLVVGIINPLTLEWKIMNIKKRSILSQGIAKSIVDAKNKVRYNLKQLGVKFNVKTKGF